MKASLKYPAATEVIVKRVMLEKTAPSEFCRWTRTLSEQQTSLQNPLFIVITCDYKK